MTQSGWSMIVAALLVAAEADSAADAQKTDAAATVKEVTINGNIMCSRVFVPPMGTDDKHTWPMVLIALGGTPEIDAVVSDLMRQYWPSNNVLDCDTARKLDEAWCAKLKYYITPDPDNQALHKKYEVEYGSWYMRVTGVTSQKDGTNWITISKAALVKDYAKENFVPPAMLLPDKPLAKAGDKPLMLSITNRLSLKCILLPAGNFYMGSPFYQIRYQDEFPHTVTLTKPFWMSEIPITQEMFESVIGRNPSLNKGPQMPAELVSIADIKEFCRVLSETNQRKVRLPTDAELEYADRVGNSNPCFDERYRDQFSHCAPKPREGLKAEPVKTKQPNAWGLYDTLCCGWTTDGDYKSCNFREDQTDPTGPTKPIQKYRDPPGGPLPTSGPLYKSRGGWYYDKVRPNQHGANKANGGYYEGTPIFRVVVEATPEEIAEMAKARGG